MSKSSAWKAWDRSCSMTEKSHQLITPVKEHMVLLLCQFVNKSTFNPGMMILLRKEISSFNKAKATYRGKSVQVNLRTLKANLAILFQALHNAPPC